ncbi:hypothetical protein ACQ4PT_069216 [Festuca glaucescens]
MGAAMVRFQDYMDRDNAVKNSHYIVQDTVMRVIEHDKGRNFRAANFTHDVWIMLLNYPPGCWDLDTVVATFAPDGRTMIGAAGGDEDPLPPDGQNPHPTPIIIDEFAAWHAHNEGPPMAHAQNAAEANVPHAPVPHAAPAAPVENEEPVVHTPAQSPAHHAEANVAVVAGDVAVDDDFIMEPVDMVDPTDDAMEPAHDSVIGSEVQTDNMLQNDSFVAVPDAAPMSAINTFHDVTQTSSNSSVRIVELQDEEVQPRNVRKKKEKPPVNVSKVRRSGSIAKLNAGYKRGKPEDDEPENESGVDLGPVFEAQVLYDTAPPPPHLPMSTL